MALKNIWVPLSGQIAQQTKVETIANNVANANTPGFKRDEVAFKEYLTALNKGSDDIHIPQKDWAPEDFYHTQGAENSFVKVDGTYTVFEQGALSPTNNALDVALKGPGFIEVLTPQGIRYTRSGQFTISKDGELVTSNGFKVLKKIAAEDQGRAPAASLNERTLKIPNSKSINIDKDGNVGTDNGLAGAISIVEFTDANSLLKEGSGTYLNKNDGNINRENIKTIALQGFVEESNVNAIKEMSELIKAHRHFENIQKAINTYDNISGRAVNDIAKF